MLLMYNELLKHGDLTFSAWCWKYQSPNDGVCVCVGGVGRGSVYLLSETCIYRPHGTGFELTRIWGSHIE